MCPREGCNRNTLDMARHQRFANGIMKENSKYWKIIIRGETHKGMTVNETCHTKSGHVMKKCIISLVSSTSIGVH